MDEPGFRAKVAELEVDLMAAEYTELRSSPAHPPVQHPVRSHRS